MVLEELKISSWIGFITGTLLIKPPWDSPYKKSWTNPVFIYHIFLSITCLIIWLDFIIHYKAAEDKVMVRRVVTISLTWGVILFKEFIRFCFSFKSSKYRIFLDKLESHYSFVSSLNPNENPISKTDKFMLGSCLSLQVTTAVSIAFIFYLRRQENVIGSWFSDWSDLQYSLVLLIFAAMPNYLLVYIAFAHVLVSTRYLMYIFEDFCSQVSMAIQTGEGELPKMSFAIYEREVCRRRIKSSSTAEFIKNNLLRQFDGIVELFKMYDEVIGVIILGLVCLTLTNCVLKINDLLAWTSVPSVMFYDAVALTVEFIQLYAIILLLGAYTEVIMNRERNKLKKMISMLPSSNLKTHLNDVVGLLFHWNWKMSGAGVFEVGRPFLTGIVFVLMTYIAIIFQVQTSTDGT